MNNAKKKKLNLNRESLVELKPDVLETVQGGGISDGGSCAVICISQNKHSCVGCG
jgi:hypothetical protein